MTAEEEEQQQENEAVRAHARALLRDRNPPEALTRFRRLGGGYSNLVCDLNDRYILRVFFRPGWDRQFAAERATLEALRDVPLVPRVLRAGVVLPRKGGAAWPTLLLTKCPGDHAFRAWLDAAPPVRTRLVQEMVATIRQVHARPAERYTVGFGLLVADGSNVTWQHLHDAAITRLLDTVRANRLSPALAGLVDETEAYYQAHRAALEYQVGPRLVHGDLHLHNMITDGERLTGIVDWEWAHGGEPDADLAALIRWALYPAHPAEEELEARVSASDYAPTLIPALLAAYPEVATIPHLTARLTIYLLVADLEQLARFPGAPTHQPEQRLRGWLRERVLEPYFPKEPAAAGM